MKQSAVYQYGRIAAFAMIGHPRFYTPLSAMRRFSGSLSGAKNGTTSVEAAGEDGDLRIWKTPLGDVATNKAEWREHVEFLIQEFERNVYLGGPVQIRSGDVVLDIGANIGLFSRQAVAAGARRVLALEPAPSTARALERNLAAALVAGTVSVLRKGAWDSHDTLRFTVYPGQPGRSSLELRPSAEDAYDIPIDVLPIDALVAEFSFERVDFIKMDIEGAEIHALKGASETLAKFKPRLAISVEHTEDVLKNAIGVRETVIQIQPSYRCIPGPFLITKQRLLVPEILFFV
ncbi:MAG: FkbM family methyltransferase [Terriglobia bacterium]